MKLPKFYTYDDYFEDVNLFNIVAGKDDYPTLASLRKQFALIQEEVKEIADGLDNKDPEEILDGAVDTLYVLNGFLRQLEKLNADVRLATLITSSNNMTKFTSDFQTVLTTVGRNPGSIFTLHKETGLYAIKDVNNKVIKPVGYVKNNLIECVDNFDRSIFDE